MGFHAPEKRPARPVFFGYAKTIQKHRRVSGAGVFYYFLLFFMVWKHLRNGEEMFVSPGKFWGFSDALENQVVFTGFHAPEKVSGTRVFFGCRTFT